MNEENNQLSLPRGMFIDDEQTIYIADSWNHRIVEWKYNATDSQIVQVEMGEDRKIINCIIQQM